MREAIVSGDVEAFGAALAPDVVWVGVLPGMLCRNREQVLERLAIGAQGRTFAPEILAEREDRIVVDPHAAPPPELFPDAHQVLVVEDDLVVEMRSYPDRESALAAAETP